MTEAEGEPTCQRHPVPGRNLDVVRIEPGGEPLGSQGGVECTVDLPRVAQHHGMTSNWDLGGAGAPECSEGMPRVDGRRRAEEVADQLGAAQHHNAGTHGVEA